jgi:hypothetical protein
MIECKFKIDFCSIHFLRAYIIIFTLRALLNHVEALETASRNQEKEFLFLEQPIFLLILKS